MGKSPHAVEYNKATMSKCNFYLRSKDSNSIVKQTLTIYNKISSKLTKRYGNRYSELLQFCDVLENHKTSFSSKKTIREALSSSKPKFLNF